MEVVQGCWCSKEQGIGDKVETGDTGEEGGYTRLLHSFGYMMDGWMDGEKKPR